MQEEIINMQMPEVIEPDNSINYNCENCATIVTGYITKPVIGPLRGMKVCPNCSMASLIRGFKKAVR